MHDLLERDEFLEELHRALATARDRRGQIALVTGEAGAGKTSVIREFLARAAGPPLVLAGGCDPLSAPRPLGPLIDAVTPIAPELADQLAAGMARAEALAAALALVDGAATDRPVTIFAIEDVHWADDATLDLITFLGRRIDALPALLVLSYRDDEVDGQHPLRLRLGELTAAIGCRIRLPPLSPAAVAQLASGSVVDPTELHRTTGGNAFYVTEVLGGDGALPESVRDAVLARVARLPRDARAVLDAAAVVPGRVEPWLLDAISDAMDTAAALDECCGRGLLRADATGAVAFRHELARLAIDDALPAGRRREFHSRALAALRSPPHGEPDDARLAHHAHAAGDATAVLLHAPSAATAASRMGAHREAARHLESALQHADLLDADLHADLLMRLAAELTTLSRWTDALRTYDLAAARFAALGDTEREAEAIIRCDRALWGLGRQPEAMARVGRAGALVAHDRPSRARALIATSETTGHMLARQFDAAESAGRRALELAELVGDRDILAEASIVSGISMTMSGDDAGLERVGRGIELATTQGNDHLVALGHMQIGTGLGELRRYDAAIATLNAGIDFAGEREIVWAVVYMRAWLARCELEQGRWERAAELAGALSRNPRCTGNSRFVTLVTLGWLRGRRGDPGVGEMLDEALELARATGHVQRLWPVACCRAEVAWLDDRLAAELSLVEEIHDLATDLGYRPAIEELAFWRCLGGETAQIDAPPETPFGFAALGRHAASADRWDVIGCPYEAAMARFHLGTADSLRAALETFDGLAALPMRRRAADALRALGARVPRGPTESTRNNPNSLTDRELDVIELVASGLTNRQIATELAISAKTVGHHVSHILAKLGVRSRAEAAVEAARLGLADPSAGQRLPDIGHGPP